MSGVDLHRATHAAARIPCHGVDHNGQGGDWQLSGCRVKRYFGPGKSAANAGRDEAHKDIVPKTRDLGHEARLSLWVIGRGCIPGGIGRGGGGFYVAWKNRRVAISRTEGSEVRFGVRGHVRAFRGRDPPPPRLWRTSMSRRPKRRRAAAVQKSMMNVQCRISNVEGEAKSME